MNNKVIVNLVSLFVAALLLSACSEPATDNKADSANPILVKMTPVRAVENEQHFEFPAEVSAVKTVDIRFEVTGRLITENLTAGDEVLKGEVLARLDPEPFQRKVKEQQTRLNQAQKELQRVRTLIEKKLAPQSTLDDAETAFELAQIAVNNAEQDLAYTQVVAPFNGQIVHRAVDNNSYVQAGEVIASIQDRSQVYFNIQVPERLFTLYASRNDAKAEASILARPTEWVDVEYVEHSPQPDRVTQTYKVVFSKPAQQEMPVTPGARAKIRVHINQPNESKLLVVPYTALLASGNDFFVWRYNPASEAVNKVAVNVVNVQGDYAGISGDLAVGDKVVSAGVNKMRDGIAVTEYTAE
ncbi:MAG: efflux RND transporter periplasmic adaptor subunit [Glaciecola sp.]